MGAYFGMKDTGHSFASYFKRATSSLLVLRLLQERPMYGYEISSEIKARSDGKYTLAILYPILYRMEEQGYIKEDKTDVADGRARSYYCITPQGLAYLEKTMEEYWEISQTFCHMMLPFSREEA